MKISTQKETSSKRKTRTLLWFVLRLVIVSALLFYVVRKNGGVAILYSISAADPFWVAMAALSFFLSIVAGAYQWFLLLKYQGLAYNYPSSFRTYYAGLFFSNFLPGTVGGDALRVYEVQKTTAGMGKVLAATVLDRLFGFFVLSLFALVAVVLSMGQESLRMDDFRYLLFTVGFVFICFVGVLFLLLSRRVSSHLHALIRRFGFKWLDDLYVRVQELCLAYRSQHTRMAKVLLVSSVVQILRINVHWFAALGLGIGISPVFFFCFIPIIALAGVVPINVGGWGIPQSIATFLYTLPGVIAGVPYGVAAGASAAALAFLPSVVGFVVMVGGGFYFVFRKPIVPPHSGRESAA